MMIDLRRIEDKFRTLDECRGYLQSLAKLQEDQITQDPINLGAAKYYLQIAIESCIDVANHLIAQSGWDRPETFAEAFSILAKKGVIEPDFYSI